MHVPLALRRQKEPGRLVHAGARRVWNELGRVDALPAVEVPEIRRGDCRLERLRVADDVTKALARPVVAGRQAVVEVGSPGRGQRVRERLIVHQFDLRRLLGVAPVEVGDVLHGRGLIAAIMRGLEGEHASIRKMRYWVVHAIRSLGILGQGVELHPLRMVLAVVVDQCAVIVARTLR